MRSVPLALVCGLLASAAWAQPAETRRIDGTVVDNQNLPIVGAQITVTDPQTHFTRTVASAADGFHVENLAPGVYTVRISASGFRAEQQQVDLTGDAARTLSIELSPAGPTEEMVVTATRSEQRVADIPASVDVVSRREIRAFAGRRGRRRAAPGAGLQPVPPDQQPGLASDGAGRLAARRRTERREPHARAARRCPVQRSLRRLGVLDARAADGHRSDRDRQRRHVQPLRQLRHGRRHQHRRPTGRSRTRSSSSRSTATAPRRSSICSRATSGGSWGRR